METAARKVQAGKARDSRRPVHEGMTEMGKEGEANTGTAVKSRKEEHSSAYLTLTGSSRFLGARLTWLRLGLGLGLGLG